jgi:2-haloacid dehalogenase
MGGVIAFDVNETLLSLEPLRRRFDHDFAGRVSLGEWFALLLHGSLLANTLDQYRPFGEIGAEALVTLARRDGVELSMDEARSALTPMAAAPPFPDVVPGVERMAAAGFRMIALTNGGTELVRAQISDAGLAPWLDRVISCDDVGRFKPDPAVYRYAAETMGVSMDEMTLVAAHDWDCAGAVAAGARAVFVKRPGANWNLPGPPPDQQVPDIGALADILGA